MKRTFSLGSALCTAALCTFTTFAAEKADKDDKKPNVEKKNEVQQLDDVVVTATKTGTSLQELGTSVTVLDDEMLRNENDNSVFDTLRKVSGLQFSRNGGPGKAASVRIRGANSNQTLILINGIRVNSHTDGAYDLGNLPVENIERIEILRGSQSASFGSEAIGGVINIVTKKGAPEKPTTTTKVEMGNDGYQKETLSFAAGNQRLDINTAVSYYEYDDSYSADRETNQEKDPVRHWSTFVNIGLNLPEEGRADFTFLHSKGNTEIDGSGPTDAFGQERITTENHAKFAISQPLNSWYTQKFDIGYTESKNDLISSYPSLYKTSGLEGALQSDFLFNPANKLSLGYNFEEYSAENKGNFEERTNRVHSAFAEHHTDLTDEFHVSLGVRRDDHSEFDGETTWSTSASWQVFANSRFHASAGTGFKAPTMNDTYWPDAWGYRGNPDLQPETSQSYDLGIEQRMFDGLAVLDVTAFQMEVKDLIDWAQNSNSGYWEPTNVAKAEMSGVEVELAVSPVDGLIATVHGNYLDARDTETDRVLARRARRTAGLNLEWTLTSALSLTSEYRFVDDRYDNAANSVELESYDVLDFGISYRFNEQFRVYGKLENIFDADYEEAAGYDSQSQYGFIGVELTF